MSNVAFWEGVSVVFPVISLLIILSILGACFYILYWIYKQKKSIRNVHTQSASSEYQYLLSNVPMGYMHLKLLFGPGGRIVDYVITEVNKTFDLQILPGSEIIGKMKVDANFPILNEIIKALNSPEYKKKKGYFSCYEELNETYFKIIVSFSVKPGYADIFFVDLSEYNQL